MAEGTLAEDSHIGDFIVQLALFFVSFLEVPHCGGPTATMWHLFGFKRTQAERWERGKGEVVLICNTTGA